MSVDYRPVAMFGIEFRREQEAREFCEKNGLDFDEIKDENHDVSLVCLNAYSGEWFILGFNFELGQTISHYREWWERYFKDNMGKTAKPILDVMMF